MASFVFDLDGVIYVDGEAIPGAAETLAALEAAGHQLLFVTNNATRGRSNLVDAIAEISGYVPASDSVISSSMAAASLLQGTVTTAFVVGESGLVDTLREVGIAAGEAEAADVVVVGLDRELTYDKLRDATLAIRRGARFVATNRDATYPTAQGLWPGGGSIVAALEAATGIEAELAGKPAEPIRSLIRSRLTSDDVWVVGDRPDTDLAMGHAEGWKTVLVLTGVTTDDTAVDPAPTITLHSVAGLPAVV
jgi:4-nitrophenyl phosphatase